MKRFPSGHLQDNGVLVDVIGEDGGWVKDRECQARVPLSSHGYPVNPENDVDTGPITSNVSAQKHLIAVNGSYFTTIFSSLDGQPQYINTHVMHRETLNGGRCNWLYLRHMIQKSR